MSGARPILWRTLSPLALRVAPALQPFMRAGRPRMLRRWVYRCLTDPYTNFRTDRFITRAVFGSRFSGTLSGLVQRRLFHFGVFEPQLTDWLSEVLQPGDAFIDVGANVGYFTLLAARLVGPAGIVVAVEPAPSTFAALQHNVALNSASNVRTVNRAAYDREATVPIYYIPAEENTGGASVVRAVGPREADVPASPLAALLHDDEIRRARVVKIDVEGAEAAALAGLAPAFDRMRPDAELVVEILPQNYAAVIAQLAGAGLHPYLFANPADPLGVTNAAARPQRLPPGDALPPGIANGSEVAYVIFSRRDATAL